MYLQVVVSGSSGMTFFDHLKRKSNFPNYSVILVSTQKFFLAYFVTWSFPFDWALYFEKMDPEMTEFKV